MKAFKTVNSKLLSFLLVMVLLMGCFGSYVSYVRADDEKIPDTTEPTIGSTENTEPSETTTAADTQDSSTTVTTTTEDTDATTTADPDTTATTTQETTGEDITDETTTEDPGATTTESVSEPAAEPYIGTTAEETAPLYVPAFDGNGRMVDYNGHQVFMLDGAYYELVDGEFVPSDYVPPEDPSDPTDPSEIADTTATEAVTDPTDPTDITDPSDTTEDTTEITDVTDVPLTEAPAVPTRPLIVRVHSDDYSGYLDIALSVDGVETTHIVGNTEKARKYKDIADVDDVVAQPYIPYGYMCSNISYSEKGNTRVIDITIQKDPTAGLSLSFVIVVGNDGGEDVTNE